MLVSDVNLSGSTEYLKSMYVKACHDWAKDLLTLSIFSEIYVELNEFPGGLVALTILKELENRGVVSLNV